MVLKRVLSAVCAALTAAFIPITVFAEDEIPAIGTEYTGTDEAPVVMFDEDLSYDYSLDIASVVVSVNLVGFNEKNGFAMKMVINDKTDSNDYYFLTLSTNTWATVDSGYGVVNDPIEPTSKGIYNLKFDVSDLGEMTNIKFQLWQGTAKLNGVYYLDKNGKVLHSSGEIVKSTMGCYTPKDGKVSEFSIGAAEAEATEASTQIITVSTEASSEKSESSLSKDMPGLFNFLSKTVFGIRVVWILAVLFVIIGVSFIVVGAMMSRKKHKKEQVNSKEKKEKAPRDVVKRG